MSVISIMLPIALVLAGFFVWLFIRSVRTGQFDDLDTPPIRAVFDDDEHRKPGDTAGTPGENPSQ